MRTAARPLVLAALAAALVPAARAAHAQSIAYAPGTEHYRIHTVVKRMQQVQGQMQSGEITHDQRVSVSLSPKGKDTLEFMITLDSTALHSSTPTQLPDISTLRGTTVHGTMSPAGKVYAYTSSVPKGDVDSQSVVEGLTKFLIVLPRDAHPGSTWTDTSATNVDRQGSTLHGQTITTSKIEGDTTIAGQRAWRISRTSVLSLRGSQLSQSQTFSMDGHGTGTGTHYVSAKGIYLGSTAEQQMDMTISLPATGGQVPVKQTSSYTVEIIH